MRQTVTALLVVQYKYNYKYNVYGLTVTVLLVVQYRYNYKYNVYGQTVTVLLVVQYKYNYKYNVYGLKNRDETCLFSMCSDSDYMLSNILLLLLWLYCPILYIRDCLPSCKTIFLQLLPILRKRRVTYGTCFTFCEKVSHRSHTFFSILANAKK